jgi:hypothetical protein
MTRQPSTPSPANHPVHTVPSITRPHARQIVITWALDPTPRRSATGTAIAELVVLWLPRSSGRPPYLRAFLRGGTRHRHGAIRYHNPPTGVAWSINQPTPRYSKARLDAFAAHALATLRAQHPDDIAYAFHPTGDPR